MFLYTLLAMPIQGDTGGSGNNGLGDLFGKVTPAPGMVTSDLGTLIAFGIRMFLVVAALLAFAFLLWGALDWITSAGEKEKLQKAQGKIINALIGLVAIAVVLAVFQLVAVNILHIFGSAGGGWQFTLPTLNPPADH